MFNWKSDINQLIELCCLGLFPEWVPSTWPEIASIIKLIHCLRHAEQVKGKGESTKERPQPSLHRGKTHVQDINQTVGRSSDSKTL